MHMHCKLACHLLSILLFFFWVEILLNVLIKGLNDNYLWVVTSDAHNTS